MARNPSPFKQIDVTRAARGVAVAGLPVGRVEIDREGKIVVFVGEGAASTADPKSRNDQWLARKAHGQK